jgi:hypothetical protein
MRQWAGGHIELRYDADPSYLFFKLEPAPFKRSRVVRSRSDGFTLGRAGFAQISAVEGIALTAEMRETMRRFDREGLSASERRRAIISRFTPPR